MSTSPKTAVRRLATARFISLTGSGAAFSALAYIIFRRTDESSLWVSLSLLVTFGAQGLFSPIGGALGDRFDRQKVMIASDLLGAVGFVLLALMRSPSLMIAMAFVTAVVESPFWPVSTAAVPNLVDDEDLSWANGTISLGRNVGFFLGPILGGALVALLAPQSTEGQLRVAGYLVYGLNAASFVVSAAIIWSVRGRFSGDRSEGEHGGFRAGFVFLWGDRVLRSITLAWVVLLLGAGATLVAEVALANAFGAGSLGYGLLTAMWAGGAVLGSLVARRFLNARREPMGLVAGVMLAGLGLGLVAVAPWFTVALAFQLSAGTGEGFSSVAEQGIVQRRTPDAVRSRVMGASEAAVLTALAASFLFGGFLVDGLGVKATYIIGGVSGIVASAVLLPILKAAAPEPDPPDSP